MHGKELFGKPIYREIEEYECEKKWKGGTINDGPVIKKYGNTL